jgi:hypothetical protein
MKSVSVRRDTIGLYDDVTYLSAVIETHQFEKCFDQVHSQMNIFTLDSQAFISAHSA